MTYTAILDIDHATDKDLDAMHSGTHYDYHSQTWIEGHDHAHMVGRTYLDAMMGPLAFCGKDLATCGILDQAAAEQLAREFLVREGESV